jgi:hypothetical protein
MVPAQWYIDREFSHAVKVTSVILIALSGVNAESCRDRRSRNDG